MSQRAWRACTPVGLMSSADSDSANAIVLSIARPMPTTTSPVKETSESHSFSGAPACRTLRR